MANSFDLSVNVRNANPSANIDHYYGTYNSVAAACAGVPKAVRLKGKTVGVIVNGSVVEYWWKSGIEDADLVEKTSGGGGDSGRKYVCTFINTAGGTSVTIPANAHNCGTEIVVQCRVKGDLANMDTNVLSNGDVIIRWGSASLINSNNPLVISIIGMNVGNVPFGS